MIDQLLAAPEAFDEREHARVLGAINAKIERDEAWFRRTLSIVRRHLSGAIKRLPAGTTSLEIARLRRAIKDCARGLAACIAVRALLV